MKRILASVLAGCLVSVFASSTLAQQTSISEKKDTASVVQPKPDLFSTGSWCSDQMTLAFNERSKERPFLSGIRFILEPQFGFVVQPDIKRVEVQNLIDLPKFALEFNLWQGWVAFQGGVIYPSTIKFDKDSEIVIGKNLKSNEHTVDVKYGLTFGLTFLDGSLAIGRGVLYFDSLDFAATYQGSHDLGFLFVNIQPASIMRTVFKNTKK